MMSDDSKETGVVVLATAEQMENDLKDLDLQLVRSHDARERTTRIWIGVLSLAALILFTLAGYNIIRHW
jgi:hypothetical protein